MSVFHELDRLSDLDARVVLYLVADRIEQGKRVDMADLRRLIDRRAVAS